MMLFWILVGLSLAGALLFIVPPLIRRGHAGVTERTATIAVYRDQLAELKADLQAGTLTAEQYGNARRELERRLLDEVSALPVSAGGRDAPRGRLSMALAIGLALPVCAVLLYLYLGHPEAVAPGKAVPAASNAGHPVTSEETAAMVARLAQRLAENPNDARGWYMLARSYETFGRYDDAVEAYAKAAALVSDDPNLLADYAGALARSRGKKLQGKPMELVQAALKLDPSHGKSLALAGSAAFNERNFALAVEYWERLLKTLPPGSDQASEVAAMVAKARQAGEGRRAAAQLPPPK